MPPGIAKKGGSGQKGMPPGIAKKFGDGWENAQGDQGNQTTTNWPNLLGYVFSSVPTQVEAGSKPTPSTPVDTSSAPQSGKAPDLPFVSQYTPDGADKSYNGAENCGPALLASIAKSRGQTDGLTDAALVNKLATAAGTTGEGTTGNGMIDALQSMGMETAATPGADLNWINTQLAQGHEVIANGDFYSVPAHADPTLQAGHYIAVTGVDNGMYSVVDPAAQNQTQMTADQLQAFIAAHPEGGFAIAAW